MKYDAFNIILKLNANRKSEIGDFVKTKNSCFFKKQNQENFLFFNASKDHTIASEYKRYGKFNRKRLYPSNKIQ